ncbi:hypothetical protein B0O80DRAFT_531872 [Mortierella sp. GBAus27b]|nr:hypothetical protein B0O80DRAFT_531872 [Mortierella sp. GBAus27b]
MANLRLFCLVEGDPTSMVFPVKIPSDYTVGDLKDLIKAKKSLEFHDVDANKLTLWDVVLTTSDSELPITLAFFKDAKKLLPREVLSSAFTGPPDDDIYIVVQRSPSATQNDPDIASEHAKMRKQLSDMEKIIAELKSTSITLGIIDKRRGKNVFVNTPQR